MRNVRQGFSSCAFPIITPRVDFLRPLRHIPHHDAEPCPTSPPPPHVVDSPASQNASHGQHGKRNGSRRSDLARRGQRIRDSSRQATLSRRLSRRDHSLRHDQPGRHSDEATRPGRRGKAVRDACADHDRAQRRARMLGAALFGRNGSGGGGGTHAVDGSSRQPQAQTARDYAHSQPLPEETDPATMEIPTLGTFHAQIMRKRLQQQLRRNTVDAPPSGRGTEGSRGHAALQFPTFARGPPATMRTSAAAAVAARMYTPTNGAARAAATATTATPAGIYATQRAFSAQGGPRFNAAGAPYGGHHDQRGAMYDDENATTLDDLLDDDAADENVIDGQSDEGDVEGVASHTYPHTRADHGTHHPPSARRHVPAAAETGASERARLEEQLDRLLQNHHHRPAVEEHQPAQRNDTAVPPAQRSHHNAADGARPQHATRGDTESVSKRHGVPSARLSTASETFKSPSDDGRPQQRSSGVRHINVVAATATALDNTSTTLDLPELTDSNAASPLQFQLLHNTTTTTADEADTPIRRSPRRSQHQAEAELVPVAAVMTLAHEELRGVVGRCIDEMRIRVAGTGFDDGVCCVRVANPRHPESSDRSRTSLAVRELFTLLMNRLWFAEDGEITHASPVVPQQHGSGDGVPSARVVDVSANGDAADGNDDDDSQRTFRYPDFEKLFPQLGGAGAVTPRDLLRLMENVLDASIRSVNDACRPSSPSGGAAVKVSSPTNSTTPLVSLVPTVTIAAPLATLRTVLHARDANAVVAASPFDPAAATAARERADKEQERTGSTRYDVLPMNVVYRPRRTGYHDARASALEVGAVIAGRYRILSLLGEATFARAVKAEDLQRPLEGADLGLASYDPRQPYALVCLKVINNTKEFFDQSLDEIRNLRILKNGAEELFDEWVRLLKADQEEQHRLQEEGVPGTAAATRASDTVVELYHAARDVNRWQSGVDAMRIVHLEDYFYYNEHMVMVCDLLKSNLYEFGKQQRRAGLPNYFTIPRVRSIAHQVVTALSFTHKLGMIHNDLKPENILFESTTRCLVRVIDFGSSCFNEDKLSSYVQSRSYRAPEVFLGADYDGRIDVWSLGCILVELLTQDVLFQSSSIPEMLARIVETCGAVPQALVARSRHADTLFTRDGAIYAAAAEGDDVRHELFAERAKPFARMLSLTQLQLAEAEAEALALLEADNDEHDDDDDDSFAAALMAANNAGRDDVSQHRWRRSVQRHNQRVRLPQRYSDATEMHQSADGSLVIEPIPETEVDDTEEDGIYLFLPEHGLASIRRHDLGDAWLELGRAMQVAFASSSLATHDSEGGDGQSAVEPTAAQRVAASNGPQVPSGLVLRFLADLEHAVRGFGYDAAPTSPTEGACTTMTAPRQAR
jgi:serine/threonine protein kinase